MKVGLLANIKPDTIQEEGQKLPNDVYAEWDSRETVQAVRDALASHGQVEVELIEALPEIAVPALQRKEHAIIFNVAEGLQGASREAQFPSLMEMLGIPYTGSGPLTLAIALDKARTKEVLSYHGIPVSRFVTTENPANTLHSLLPDTNFPVVVKPLAEGSSKGVRNSSFATNDLELQNEVERIKAEYRQESIIEEFLPGREFTVAVLGSGKKARVLPIVEINFNELPEQANKIYSYEAKWVYDVAESPLDIFSCPAQLEDRLRAEIEAIVLETFHVLDCQDWARIDVRLDAKGRPNIIEVNPLPGILPRPEENSCYPKAARAAGLSYEHTLLAVLKSACDRYKIPFQFEYTLSN